MLTRQQIVNQARKYLGVAYVHQGRTAQGLDCLGLIVKVAQDLGIPHTDRINYSRVANGIELVEELRAQLVRTFQTAENLKPGNIVCLSLPYYPCHLAIVTDRGIIHAINTRRRVVEHGLDSDWKRKIREVYNYPGVTD